MLLLLLLSLIIVTILYIVFHPTFGGSPNPESKVRIKNSPNFNGKNFINLIPTQPFTYKTNDKNTGKIDLLKNFLFPPKDKNPKKIVSEKLNTKSFTNGEFIWLGHSTILFKTNNTTIITDPVFHNAAPIPFMVQPFKMSNKPKIKDLPFIDVVLISHDHYDHLDYKAIKKLNSKVGHFCVPLGVKAHLLRWGIPNKKISEYDWYEQAIINDIKLIFTPSRHFSGRGIFNRNTTLWGSWVVISPKIKIYFSGDGGYSPEFAKIGQRFGKFDIAFIENGAYNKRWENIHMLPEQSAQAGIDVQAKIILPIHWSKFDLSTHKWNEPVKRIKEALFLHNDTISEQQKIQLATPKIGEIFSLEKYPQSEWWEK